MTEKRFIVAICGDGKLGIRDLTTLNEYTTERQVADYMNRVTKENEQLKQRCKELRNDLIDHSALINMLEDVKSLRIEDMIWNTMGYKTQTEFDDDFADYREDAKKRWRE